MTKKVLKRRKPSKKVSELAAQVLGECAFAVGQAIEREMATDPRPYRMAPAARDFWLELHLESIPIALAQPGANWVRDRAGVLLMAGVLGRRAARHALDDAGTAAGITIKKTHVKQASDETSADPDCTAGTSGGSGPYCEIV